jgi:cytochrome c oxidase assembly protein Cox11
MELIGRIDNTLYHAVHGPNVIISSVVKSSYLNDIIEYTKVPVYSSFCFIELAAFGGLTSEQLEEYSADAITPDDIKLIQTFK